MKNQLLQKLFLSICWSQIVAAGLLAQVDSANRVQTTESPVLASSYATFLNDVALIDPNHLFNEAMSTDPKAACIVRLGAPGNYHYDSIAGRENFPITYVSLASQSSYCRWLQQNQVEDDILASDILAASDVGFAVQTTSLAELFNINFNKLPVLPAWSTNWKIDAVIVLGAVVLGYGGYRYCEASRAALSKEFDAISADYNVMDSNKTTTADNDISILSRQTPEERTSLRNSSTKIIFSEADASWKAAARVRPTENSRLLNNNKDNSETPREKETRCRERYQKTINNLINTTYLPPSDQSQATQLWEERVQARKAATTNRVFWWFDRNYRYFYARYFENSVKQAQVKEGNFMKEVEIDRANFLYKTDKEALSRLKGKQCFLF